MWQASMHTPHLIQKVRTLDDAPSQEEPRGQQPHEPGSPPPIDGHGYGAPACLPPGVCVMNMVD